MIMVLPEQKNYSILDTKDTPNLEWFNLNLKLHDGPNRIFI